MVMTYVRWAMYGLGAVFAIGALGYTGWQYRRARRAALTAPPEDRVKLELEFDERRHELRLAALISPLALAIAWLAPSFLLVERIPN